jgi:hypothetical protein
MSDTPNGPRIALVGSCQVIGIRAALLKLCPDAEVKAWHIGLAKETKADIAAQLDQYDLVVSQVREVDQNAPLALPRLEETQKRVLFMPTLVFNGFHPDCIYIKLPGKLLTGPLTQLHSGIIAASYALDVPEQKVLRLFNSLTYSSLGYFDAFNVACDMMLSSFSAADYDLAPYVDGWRQTSGSFMHTLNHPNIQVLTRLAHMLGVRAGYIDESIAVPEDVTDFLALGMRWPIYPEIARRLALPKESIVFKRTNFEVDLATVITQFYAAYKDVDRAAIRAALPARLVAGMETVLAT